jgi:hypothetical protein
MADVSDKCLGAVESVLDARFGQTPAGVEESIRLAFIGSPTYSRITIRHALRELVRMGRARRVGMPTKFLYFRSR